MLLQMLFVSLNIIIKKNLPPGKVKLYKVEQFFLYILGLDLAVDIVTHIDIKNQHELCCAKPY